MLMNFDAVSKLIESNELLHIAGTENLLRKLPKGQWIGGSTEYFMAKPEGKISDELMFVTKLSAKNFSIKSYDTSGIKNIAADAFDTGFSIVIIPFDSAVHTEYAENAAEFENMFMKNVAGWISGLNLGKSGQTPIAVNGVTGEVFSDKAVGLHLELPSDKTVSVNIINIFEIDEKSPVIKFTEEGFAVKKCFIDGKEVVFADYIAENVIDTKLPLIGEYSGAGVNVSFRSIENGIVNLYAPVFNNIDYRLAKSIPDYMAAFRSNIDAIKTPNAVFSCNCILNFLYGELEGKDIEKFEGPITFGEVAYQLVNQTLVYVSVQ